MNETLNNNLNDNKEDNSIISELIQKIEELPFDEETTIAKLINYNPNERFVDPLEQGKIFSKLKEMCKQKNIEISLNHDKFTGLAFHYTFSKVRSNNIS